MLCLSSTNVLHRGETAWKHTGRPRTVRTEVSTLARPNRFWTVDEITAAAAAGISHGTCHKILSDDLNMSHVTQHSVPRVLTQDQRDRMSICGDLIDSAIPTLADLHSRQRRLFWGRMWICVSVCEYLVIWCNNTTVHEIIDCSSI
jgi:hypothetical protein